VPPYRQTPDPVLHVTQPAPPAYVSRGGEKLAAVLERFQLDVSGLVCADLGSHVGGFVDCLLRRSAARVYAVDTCYGTLAWKLRRDRRVVPLERTNAMHVVLPEAVDLITVDVGWTRQAKVMPNVVCLLKPTGRVVTLIKPHYEAERELLVDGVLPGGLVDQVVENVLQHLAGMGWAVCAAFSSPILGHGGNREVFALLSRM
jgi:23S rRNA (cytidine1920-2'-O)/16S rRNA (cytidine1409-2'-O)-methyltransferase